MDCSRSDLEPSSCLQKMFLSITYSFNKCNPKKSDMIYVHVQKKLYFKSRKALRHSFQGEGNLFSPVISGLFPASFYNLFMNYLLMINL